MHIVPHFAKNWEPQITSLQHCGKGPLPRRRILETFPGGSGPATEIWLARTLPPTLKLASATQGACGALPVAVEAPLAATQGACSTDANQKKHHRVSKPSLEAQPALDDTNQMTNRRVT
ncbi:unnamed protein product [Effrenium voratum]|uniref:Uncharacterized protein n=1 Tax=Effrenium voratum TaxID=2562239 RepID=A0AA36MIZ1_9DINO|nr:unnamed protein product [Effrenium voratum]CAJ1430152.1 unnamed protein product [Effrenium voratum]